MAMDDREKGLAFKELRLPGESKDAPRAMTYYELLRVAPCATDEEIKAAYRRRSLEEHPDRRGGDVARFQKLKHAHTVLSDPRKRAAYDKYGPGLEPGPGHLFGGAVGLLPVFVGSASAGAVARATTPLVVGAVLVLAAFWRAAADSGAARQHEAADPGALMVACGVGFGSGAALTSGTIWVMAHAAAWARALLFPQGVS